MKVPFLRTGALRFVFALWMAAIAIASADAYVHYRLSETEFYGAAFDAASALLYGISSRDGAIHRWQTATQHALETITPPEGTVAVAVLPDADLAISTGEKYETVGKFVVWKLSSGEVIATIASEQGQEILAVSADGHTCAMRNGSVISLWTLANGERKANLTGHTREPFLAMFSRDGRLLASVEHDDVVRLWDVERGQFIGTLDTSARVILFSPDGSFLFTSDGEEGLVWDVRLRVPVARFAVEENIQGMTFSSDGTRLLVVDYDGIYQWNYDPARFHRAQAATATDRIAMLSSAQKWQHFKELPELTVSLWSTGFHHSPPVISPNGRWIASASGEICLFDAVALDLTESTKPRRLLKYPDKMTVRTTAITFSHDGVHLAAVSAGAVTQWDVTSGRHLATWKNETVNDDSTLSFSGDKKLLAISGWSTGSAITVLATQGHQRVFHVEYSSDFRMRLQKPWKGALESSECSAVFAPSGTTMAWVGPWDNQVALFDVAKRKMIGQFRDPTQITTDRQALINDGPVTAVTFSNDGQTLAAGYQDGMVKLWDAKTGKWLRNLADPGVEHSSDRSERSHAYEVIGIAFLPDGNVVSMDSYCVKFWDAKSGALVKKLDGHFSSLSFARDGQSFATGKRIWDRSTMRRRANLEKLAFTGAVFSPDGEYLAVPSDEGVVLIDGEPFEGLFVTPGISRTNVRWLGRTLTELGYLNPEVNLKAAAYRAGGVGHVALTLPPGAPSDEIILTAMRDVVGPKLAERLGPKLAVHLCDEQFQVARTIELERPLTDTVADVLESPPAHLPAIPVSETSVEAARKPVESIEGAWRVKLLIVNGKPGKFDTRIVYRFGPNRLIVGPIAASSASFAYTTNTSFLPHRLDMNLSGPQTPEDSRMIYKIDGGTLTICFGPPGSDYPADFTSEKGTRTTKIVLRPIDAASQ